MLLRAYHNKNFVNITNYSRKIKLIRDILRECFWNTLPLHQYASMEVDTGIYLKIQPFRGIKC